MSDSEGGAGRSRAARVSGQPPPPTDAEPRWVQIEYARVGEPWSGYILGEQMSAVRTHWDNGRSRLCLDAPGCQWCACNSTPRICYYLAGWNEDEGCDAIVLMPGRAASKMLDLADVEGQMRGLRVRLHKCGRGPKGWYDVELLGKALPGSGLRKGFDVGPHLCRVFGVDALPTWINGKDGE